MARPATQPLSADRSTTNGTTSTEIDSEKRRPPLERRVTKRNMPLIALGILLVVGCAIGFSSAWLRAGGHQQVLVVATNVSAGHILTSTDLRTVQLSTGNGLSPIPASEASVVIGHPVALPLASGSLLTEADLGPSALPPSGRAVVGLALKSGQYPPEIEAGAKVLVVISSGSGSQGSSTATSSTTDAPIQAIVIGVELAPANSSDAVVVSVQVAEGSGAAVAAAGSAGSVTLVIVSSGSGS